MCSNREVPFLDKVCHGFPDIGETNTGLLEAAAVGNLARVKQLLACKAELNAVDYDRRTPLHVAAACGQVAIVQHLLACGADATRQDRWGRSPIADAVDEGHCEVEQALLLCASKDDSLHLRVYCPGEVTVLVVDIKNFTARCAEKSARDVGAWISAFYALVRKAAGPCGVRKAEMRGDCCICVTGGMAAAPCGRLRSDASMDDQVSRMLDFASALHESLLQAETLTSVRMGVAFGEAAFLLDGGFLSVQGDVVNVASRMEGHASPGVAVVHESAIEKWLDEGVNRERPDCCSMLACKGKGLQLATGYDCGSHAFVSLGAQNMLYDI